MQERLLKTGVAEYKETDWDGKNTSGFIPFGDRVLILPDLVADKTSGAILLPEQITERMQMAAETGRLIAVGDGAFAWNGDKTTELMGRKPKVGDRVFIERFAGQLLRGKDGKSYRIIEDRSIGAIQE